jgi:hypothetical protein
MSLFRRAGAAIARFFQSAADPAAELDVVKVYAKDVAGTSQLFARTDDGAVNQLTPVAVAGAQAVIFDDLVPADQVNIRSDRATNQSPIDNTDVGVTNFGSNSLGVATGATGAYSTIGGGDNNTASGLHSTVPGGDRCTASGIAAHAEGSRTTASGEGSHAEGIVTAASLDGAHAEGISTTASGVSAHAEGTATTASDTNAHAEGDTTQAIGPACHAEGEDTLASVGASHAEGSNTQATNAAAHAEGSGTVASGASGAHAEGISTTASGSSAHAQGNATVASGFNAHAEGRNSTASGDYSHAQGLRAIASREGQFAHASGTAGADGEYQTSWLVLHRGSTDAPATVSLLFGEGSALSNIVLTDGKAYTFRVRVVAVGAAGAQLATIVREFNATRIAGVTTVVAQSVQTIIGSATAVANWTIDGTASATGLQVVFDTVADAATLNITVTGHVEFTEVPIAP